MFAKKQNKKFADAIIMNDERVSVEALRKKAKRANTKFWGMAVSMGMISSLVLPYMSMAAVAPSNSNVFTGHVIPGYSMGGVTLAAYGVDINSWGEVKQDTVVGSNYGVWSGKRLDTARQHVGDTSHLFQEGEANTANYELTAKDKAVGWQGITGNMGFTTSSPDGTDNTSAANQYDTVAPYRTVSDYTFWSNRMLESNGAASASINVSLFADFIIVTKDDNGNAHVLLSPDEVNSGGEKILTNLSEAKEDFNSKTTWGDTMATPYYIPLSVIFKKYNLEDSKDASISALMDAIGSDKGKKLSDCITEGNNLLENTSYKPVNNDALNETSNAFNPYPYSMVFSMNTDNGEVVSSIYDNSEAYVYFSPSSVYSQYIALRTEYERLRNSASSALNDADKESKAQDPATVFQLGYYLAEMSILEAYLNEALPQDMTRGYVGPTESADLIGTEIPGNGETKNISCSSPEDLRKISYVSLMYDFSVHMSKNNWDTAASQWRQTETDAIMDVLSVFGYGLKDDSYSSGTGVMKGMNALQNISRKTLFGIYQREYDFTNGKTNNYASDATTRPGIYTPTYYPIQQHKMPDSEKVYRFQIINSVPYETVIEYIRNEGFADGVKLMYSATGDGLEGFKTITVSKAREKVAALASQYEAEEEAAAKGENAEKVALDTINNDRTEQLQVLGGTSTTEVGKRIDSALLGYTASNMNSDNVHDLFDVIRGTRGLKLETWIRYYNPLKSAGGDNDFFLTRISPALTTYFPAILVNGYTPAGGHGEKDGCEVSSALSPYGVAFDYFSIPSFAPCFASHTSDTSYYGVLNYELRPFYAKSFISTLSESANVPAVDAKEAAEEELNKAEDAAENEAKVTNQNLACLYVLGKRVAYAKTMRDIMNQASVTKSELLGILDRLRKQTTIDSKKNSSTNSMVTGAPGKITDTATNVQNAVAYQPNTILGINVSELYQKLSTSDVPDELKLVWNRKGIDGTAWIKNENDNDFDINSQAGIDNIQGATSCNGVYAEKFDDSMLGGGFFSNVNHYLEGLKKGTDENDIGTIAGGQNFNGFKEYCEARQLRIDWKINNWEDDSQNNEKLFIPASLYFTALYDRHFNQILGQDYYWDNWGNIYSKMEHDNLEPDSDKNVSFDRELETGKYETKITGTMLQNVAKDVAYDPAEAKNIDDFVTILTAQMDKASDEIAQSMINLIKDYNLLTSTMPSKMQNCLAWADYQNSTDSEAQYQVDPSNANVVVNVGDSSSNQGSTKPDHIKNKEQAEEYFTVTQEDDGFHMTNSSAASGDGLGLEGRLERGVEGSTWTSTVHPALYTMTATIARVNSMSSVTGTTYPYSGLANGRLQSGTDKYAVMQAHVIDYTSIASGIAGDLSTRTRAQVVSLVEPQYAAISDFTDVLGILGAMMGEMGSAMVSESAKAFTGAMFDSSGSGVATSSGSNNSEAASSTMSYMMSDGTTMNRTPAALATFNPNTGKLEYGTVVNNASSNYISTASNSASAAGNNSGMTAMAGDLVLNTLALPYKVIQTFALTLVLIFIGFIAFRNFYAYASGVHGAAMIQAQMHLKTVLWRSVMAVVMIGLPPIAGGTGFEGGNFIVLEVISNIAAYISTIFVGDNGSGAIAFFTNVNLLDSYGFNIGIWLLYFLCCAIIAICFALGTFLVFILKIVLLLFFLLGPIVWALFVWPYNAKSEKQSLTNYLNLGFLSSGAVGNLAPKGHIWQFSVFSAILIAWSLLFWFVAQIFVIGAGVQYTDVDPSGAAELVAQSTGYATASMAVSNAYGIMDYIFDNTAGDAINTLRLLFTTLICALVFLLMGYLLMKALFRQIKASQGLGHDIKEGIKNGIKKADEAWNGTEEKGGIKDGLQAAASAARVLKNGYDTKPERDHLKKLQKAQKQLMKGNMKNGQLPDDMQKFLKEEGYTNEQIAELKDSKAARDKLAKDLGDKRALGEAKMAEKSAAAKKARRDARWTGADGTQSVGNMLKNTAKTAKALAGAATRGDGMMGVWEGIAQTAKTLNEAAIDKETDAISKESAALETAKEAAEKLLADGGKIDEAYLKGLDDEAFKALKEAGLVDYAKDADGNVIKDANGKAKRVQTQDAAALADKAAKNLDEQIKRNQQKILSKEKEKDDVANRLAKLGLSKDATLQEGLKVLKDGFDNQKAVQIAKEMGFQDDADGSALSKAKKYMTNDEFRKEKDDELAGIEQAARMLGINLRDKDGNINENARKQAEALVSERSSMAELCGIEKESDANKRMSRMAETTNKIAESLGDKALPTEDRAEAIKLATGVYPPEMKDRQAIQERVMNGTATASDYQKYAAMQISEKMAGRELALPNKEVGMNAALEALDSFTGVTDPAQFADEHVIKTARNGSVQVEMPMEMALTATNQHLMDGVASALTDEALSKYDSETIAKLRQSASKVIKPGMTAEENMQAMQDIRTVARNFENDILDTFDGRKAKSGFEEREAAAAAVAEHEKRVADMRAEVKEARRAREAAKDNPYGKPQSEVDALLRKAMEAEVAAATLLAEEENAFKAMQRQEAKVKAETAQYCGEYKDLNAYKAAEAQEIAKLVIGGAALGAVGSFKDAVELDRTVTKQVYASQEIGAHYAEELLSSITDPAMKGAIEQRIAQNFDGKPTMNDIMNMDISSLPPAMQDMFNVKVHMTADAFAHSDKVLDMDPMLKVNMSDEQVSAYYQNVPRTREAIEHVAEYTGQSDILTRQDHQDMYASFTDFVDMAKDSEGNKRFENLKFDDNFVKCANYVGSRGCSREDMEAIYMKQAGDKATKEQKEEFMRIVDGAIAYNAHLIGAGRGDILTAEERKERAEVDRNIALSGGKARPVAMVQAPHASEEREWARSTIAKNAEARSEGRPTNTSKPREERIRETVNTARASAMNPNRNADPARSFAQRMNDSRDSSPATPRPEGQRPPRPRR